MTTYRPTQLSVDDLLNKIRFVPNAPLAEPHDTCDCCGLEWPTRCLSAITDQSDANRVAGLLEEDPDRALCPECRAALVAEARATTCKCGDHRCDGPRQVDVDRWECRTYR